MSETTPSPEDITTAVVEACRQQLKQTHAAMRRAVRGLSPEAIAWKPPAPDTNSLTALISHALDAERYFVHAALDQTVDRDREAQFARVVDEADRLLEDIDATEAEVWALLDRITPERLTASVERRTSDTGAAWLMKATVHAREHSGQAELTRDLARAALETPAA